MADGRVKDQNLRPCDRRSRNPFALIEYLAWAHLRSGPVPRPDSRRVKLNWPDVLAVRALLRALRRPHQQLSSGLEARWS